MSDESRKQFEYEAGKALRLPTSIIELARKGDGYDHAYNSMNVMQPLNEWWHWWQKSRAALVVVLPKDVTNVTNKPYEEGRDDVIDAIEKAGITVKGEGDGETNILPPQ